MDIPKGMKAVSASANLTEAKSFVMRALENKNPDLQAETIETLKKYSSKVVGVALLVIDDMEASMDGTSKEEKISVLTSFCLTALNMLVKGGDIKLTPQEETK